MRKELIFLAILFGVFLFFLSLESAFAACPTPTDGQDYYVTSSCIFDWNVNGVENGNIIVEEGVTLTVGGILGGQTIVFNPGYSIINNGSIALNKTAGYAGQIKKAYIWTGDSDGDTYNAYIVSTDPTNPPFTGAIRRYTTTTLTAQDCNDNSSSTYQFIASLVKDADQDRYYIDSAAVQCVGSATTAANTYTYYKDSNGNYTWVSSGDALGANDCNDGDSARWQNRTCYYDGDNDGYRTDASATRCVGSDCTNSVDAYNKESTVGLDCYDANANAKPGQTSYFTTDRGDGSFDYDCSGQIEKNENCSGYDKCMLGTLYSCYSDGKCSNRESYVSDYCLSGPSVSQSCGVTWNKYGQCVYNVCYIKGATCALSGSYKYCRYTTVTCGCH